MLAIVWRPAGLCLLLVMTACGDDRQSPPTAPTVPDVPSVPVTPTPTPTFTLSGVVTERFSGRPNSRIVAGTVFEITADGRQPLRNIWVAWEGSGSGDAFAETRTDAAGRYRLCGLPKGASRRVCLPGMGQGLLSRMHTTRSVKS